MSRVLRRPNRGEKRPHDAKTIIPVVVVVAAAIAQAEQVVILMAATAHHKGEGWGAGDLWPPQLPRANQNQLRI